MMQALLVVWLHCFGGFLDSSPPGAAHETYHWSCTRWLCNACSGLPALCGPQPRACHTVMQQLSTLGGLLFTELASK